MTFQVHLYSLNHQENVRSGKYTRPVVALIKVRDDGTAEWRKEVHEVFWTGGARTVYDHEHGGRFGASMWVSIWWGTVRYLEGTEWKEETI